MRVSDERGPLLPSRRGPASTPAGGGAYTSGRLVTRFGTGGQLNILLRLGGADAARSRPVVADVINISITGALVRIKGELPVWSGATVTLGDGESTARCRVVHATSLAGTPWQDLGIEITEMTDPFHDELHQVIAALRNDRGQIHHAWKHSR